MKVLGINRAELLVENPDAVMETFDRLFNGAVFTDDIGVHNRPLDCRHDWQHGLELVHPTDENDRVGQLLKQKGEGAILTVVYEVESIDDAREYLKKNGFEIQYEGDYSAHEDVTVYKQLCVRPEATNGFFVTFMERKVKPGAARVAQPRDKNGMKVLGIQRAEILVADPDAAEATFKRLFNGATFTTDRGVHNRPLDCRTDYEHGLELVHPKDENDAIGQLLKKKGDGAILTIVYEVEDMDIARKYLKENGFEIQYDADYGGHDHLATHKQIVIRPHTTHGLLVTLMEGKRKAKE
jgi:hypothetical protein